MRVVSTRVDGPEVATGARDSALSKWRAPELECTCRIIPDRCLPRRRLDREGSRKVRRSQSPDSPVDRIQSSERAPRRVERCIQSSERGPRRVERCIQCPERAPRHVERCIPGSERAPHRIEEVIWGPLMRFSRPGGRSGGLFVAAVVLGFGRADFRKECFRRGTAKVSHEKAVHFLHEPFPGFFGRFEARFGK